MYLFKKKLLLVVMIFFSLLIVGCASRYQYVVSLNNIDSLKGYKQYPHREVALAGFTNVRIPKSKILCRLNETISLPSGETFQSYLQKAMQQELAYSGLYDPKSPVKLYGRVDRIDFISVPGRGKWVIAMTFRVNGGEPFSIKSSYPFITNLYSETGCDEISLAYASAVEKFLNKLYNLPEFKAVFTNALTNTPSNIHQRNMHGFPNRRS